MPFYTSHFLLLLQGHMYTTKNCAPFDVWFRNLPGFGTFVDANFPRPLPSYRPIIGLIDVIIPTYPSTHPGLPWLLT